MGWNQKKKHGKSYRLFWENCICLVLFPFMKNWFTNKGRKKPQNLSTLWHYFNLLVLIVLQLHTGRASKIVVQCKKLSISTFFTLAGIAHCCVLLASRRLTTAKIYSSGRFQQPVLLVTTWQFSHSNWVLLRILFWIEWQDNQVDNWLWS